MSSTIHAILIQKACFDPCRGWDPASRAKTGCTLSKVWFRTYIDCRRVVHSLLAATRKRLNVRLPRFRSSPLRRAHHKAKRKRDSAQPQERFVASMPNAAEPLLIVEHLKKYFPIHRGVFGGVADYVKA